jgi:hypothetical protein
VGEYAECASHQRCKYTLSSAAWEAASAQMSRTLALPCDARCNAGNGGCSSDAVARRLLAVQLHAQPQLLSLQRISLLTAASWPGIQIAAVLALSLHHS